MNLEQLLERQKGLNDLLQLHLHDLENTVDRIAGVVSESGVLLEAEKQPNGILEELFSAQERLEQKIDKLNYLKHRLHASVYEETSEVTTSNIPQKKYYPSPL